MYGNKKAEPINYITNIKKVLEVLVLTGLAALVFQGCTVLPQNPVERQRVMMEREQDDYYKEMTNTINAGIRTRSIYGIKW